ARAGGRLGGVDDRAADQEPGADDGDPRALVTPAAHKEKRFSATCNGFDVHCAVRLAADDDEGRERLLRYCAGRASRSAGGGAGSRPPTAVSAAPIAIGRRSYWMV